MNLQFYLPIFWEKKNLLKVFTRDPERANTFDEDIINNSWLNWLFKNMYLLKTIGICALRLFSKSFFLRLFKSLKVYYFPKQYWSKKFLTENKNLIWWYLKNTLNTNFLQSNIAIKNPTCNVITFLLHKIWVLALNKNTMNVKIPPISAVKKKHSLESLKYKKFGFSSTVCALSFRPVLLVVLTSVILG